MPKTSKFECVNGDKDKRREVGGRTLEVRCCRVWLPCHGMTSTCEACGTDYNWAGQRLAPRSQCGEETGEHWTDVANQR